jgi:hypothetical protein
MTPGVIETQFRAWGAELDRLKAKVEKELAEAEKEYYEHVGEPRDDIATQLEKWAKEVEILEPTARARARLRDLRAKTEVQLEQWEPEIEALKSNAGKELKHASGAAWED